MVSQGGLTSWQAKRVAAFVEAHLGENCQVGDLAKVALLSTSHFSRAFKKSFGETPRDYLTRRRIHHAQAIMLSSEQPLAKIALDCGMADQSHFCRAFRRVVGVSPALWRRRLSGSDSPQVSSRALESSQ
jgi:AraC-like DNA-binding protein